MHVRASLVSFKSILLIYLLGGKGVCFIKLLSSFNLRVVLLFRHTLIFFYQSSNNIEFTCTES